MSSLRFKLTAALFGTSLIAVLVVGLLGRWLVLRNFSDTLKRQSFERFSINMRHYLETYGSWENAERSESFPEFEHRTRRLGPGQDGEPPGMPDEFAPDSPPSRAPGAGDGVGLAGGRPPFLFLLLDPNGRVLLGDSSFQRGSLAPAHLIRAASPIEVNGEVAVLAVPLATPNLSRITQTYLDSVQQALLYGALAATVLTLTLGLLLGSRLSRNLRTLTQGLRTAGAGVLDVQLEIRSNDEVGELARAFNRMSVELAAARDLLVRSRAQVEEQAAQLREISLRDALTGLANRRFFDAQFARMFAHARRHQVPLSLVMCDLDHFKRVNDTLGHAAGDEVLRRVSQVLAASVRETDVAARWGGEEFALALDACTGAAAAQLCERIRTALAELDWSDVDPSIHVTMSFGVCGHRLLDSTVEMLAAADRALYDAKRSGRDRVCLDTTPSPSPPTPA